MIHLVLFLMSALPASAQEGGRTLDAARQRLEFEPNVSETMQATLRNFRVDAESFDGLRSASNWRAILPTLSAGYRLDDGDTSRNEVQTITDPRENVETTGERTNIFSVGGVWD